MRKSTRVTCERFSKKTNFWPRFLGNQKNKKFVALNFARIALRAQRSLTTVRAVASSTRKPIVSTKARHFRPAQKPIYHLKLSIHNRYSLYLISPSLYNSTLLIVNTNNLFNNT